MRAHREGCEALWAWFQLNYDLLIDKLPPGLSMLGTVISMITSNFTTKAQAQEVAAFFKDKSVKGFDRALAQSMDAVAAKASWVERDQADVREWLRANGYLAAEKGRL